MPLGNCGWVSFFFPFDLKKFFWSMIALHCCLSFCCVTVDQLCVSTYSLPFESPSHPRFPHHSAPSWASWTPPLLPTVLSHTDSAAPWTIALQAPLSMEFSRQEYWSSLPIPTPEDRPNPGVETVSLESPAWAGGIFTTSATWEAWTSH